MPNTSFSPHPYFPLLFNVLIPLPPSYFSYPKEGAQFHMALGRTSQLTFICIENYFKAKIGYTEVLMKLKVCSY